MPFYLLVCLFIYRLFICNSKTQTTAKDQIKDGMSSLPLTLKLSVRLLYKESHMTGGRKNLGFRIITRKEIEDWLLTQGSD